MEQNSQERNLELTEFGEKIGEQFVESLGETFNLKIDARDGTIAAAVALAKAATMMMAVSGRMMGDGDGNTDVFDASMKLFRGLLSEYEKQVQETLRELPAEEDEEEDENDTVS